MNTQILFISHDASRTGAPIVFLHFLKWFKANYDIPFQIILRKGGELESEFAEVAPVTIFHPQFDKQNFILKILKYFGFHYNPQIKYLKKLKSKLYEDNIKLIYSNTITNGEILHFLSDLECPVVTHVHELEMAIKYYTDPEHLKKVRKYTSKYIAVSEAVRNNLIVNHNISEEKINLAYEFISTKNYDLNKNIQKRKLIFEQLGIAPEDKIVCASGTTDWRKGADLFIQLALAVSKRYADTVHFLWIGGQTEKFQLERLLHDVESTGLEKYVHFLGTQKNPLAYFALCDVFTLVSREDPFPLVCLEAASLEKPIVCFDNAGGEREFVEDDCGFVVPYLDIETMASKVVHLLDSAELRQTFGQRAKQKLEQRHDIAITGNKVAAIVKQFLPEYSAKEHNKQKITISSK